MTEAALVRLLYRQAQAEVHLHMQESVVPVKDDVAIVVVQKQSPGWAPIQEPELFWRSRFPVHQCAEEDAAVALSGGSAVHSQLDSKGTRIPPTAGQICHLAGHVSCGIVALNSLNHALLAMYTGRA